MIGAAGIAYLRPTPALKQATVSASFDPQVVTNNPVNYVFVSPSMGWASLVLAGPSPGAGQFRVFRTVDGARHWQQQLAGQSTIPGFSPITVKFFGKLHGFMAVGGTVQQFYRTSDGGAHWDSLVLPVPRVAAITFSDSTHGWLLTYTGAGLGHVYATSDAGQTWQQLQDPPADAAGLSFRRPTEGWLGSFGPGPPHLYTSSDATQSWQQRDLPPPPGGSWDPTMVLQVFVDLLGYQDSLHWWATSANALFKSADAGQSWSDVATIPAGWQFSQPGVIDSTHAWASLFVAGGNGLALTSDGGLHWTLANVPKPP